MNFSVDRCAWVSTGCGFARRAGLKIAAIEDKAARLRQCRDFTLSSDDQLVLFASSAASSPLLLPAGNYRGKGAWRDNVFVERLWRSIKYEEVYLHAYKTVSEARAGIGRYLNFYNTRRPHSSLDRRTPDQAYFNALTPMMVAA